LGVVDVTCGYQGGQVEAPSEQQFRAGVTGHATSVEVIYDPQEVSYRGLLERFFVMLESPQPDHRQSELETHSRHAIFYLFEEERLQAEALISERPDRGNVRDATELEVIAATTFWSAENPHLDDRA